ncbi:MAG: IS4 family transposase [Caulobacterales bacterium]|nr:IS4 family transposase [Caulobacterales bacterium]
MHEGKIVFSQVMDHLPQHTFRRLVERYGADRSVKSFSCQDQFRCMAFAQLTCRDSLRDTVICLNAQQAKLFHMGIRGQVRRSTLADANERRDWRLYAALAAVLIATARRLYAGDRFGADLEGAAYALDTTTIDLCLSLFPWARFRLGKGAVKLHTMIDLRGNIPVVVHIDDGKSYDTDILDVIAPEPGAIYVMDRGYLDFTRLRQLNAAGAFFVIRARDNFRFRRITSRPVDRTTGVICDQTVVLTVRKTVRKYPGRLRRIRYRDPKTRKTLVFLTNNLDLPSRTNTDLYRCRWQIELFFKWIKQHLRIRRFFGNSQNAVKTQIWIAVCVYVLIAIIKKRLASGASLYTILQMISVTAFEKMPLDQLLSFAAQPNDRHPEHNQLNLFTD